MLKYPWTSWKMAGRPQRKSRVLGTNTAVWERTMPAMIVSQGSQQVSSVLWKCKVNCTNCFWEKGLCRKLSLSWTAYLSTWGQLSAILKPEVENLYLFLSRIGSYFIFCPLQFTLCFYWTLLKYSRKEFQKPKPVMIGGSSLGGRPTLGSFIWGPS